MNLTGFAICIAPNCQIAYSDSCISDISLPNRTEVLSFSEYLNTMPSVLVAGSERREDKNIEI